MTENAQDIGIRKTLKVCLNPKCKVGMPHLKNIFSKGVISMDHCMICYEILFEEPDTESNCGFSNKSKIE